MRKNIFDKFQDKLSKQLESFEKREDKALIKKTMFWMIFFFPYGLYLLFFKTKTNKFIKALIGIFFAFMIVISVDIIKNPNRVYNEVGKASYDEFVLNNENLKLEKSLYVNKNNHFLINDNMYFSFTIYDKLNMYYGIFEINNYNKDYKLVSLYDVDYNFNNIYSTGDFKKVKDIHPVVLNFIMTNSKDMNFDRISKSTDVKEVDLFKNKINQDIFIDNTLYHFEFNDFDVISIKKDSDNKDIYSLDMHNSLEVHLSEATKKLLLKNFNLNYELVGYNYLNNEHYYNLFVGDKPYCAIYYPGHGVDLIRISDTKSFSTQLKNLMKK